MTVAFTLADGLKADGARLVDGLRQAMNAPCSEDWRRMTVNSRAVSFLSTPRRLKTRSLGSGRLRAGFLSGSKRGKRVETRGGRPERVTRTEGPVLHEIDGRPAEDVPSGTDKNDGREWELAVLPLAEYTSNDDSQFVLRSCSHFEQNGPVTLLGRVIRVQRVRVCHAALEEILGGVETATPVLEITGSNPLPPSSSAAPAGNGFWQSPGQEEVDRTIRELGALPLIGIPFLRGDQPISFKGRRIFFCDVP